MSIKAHCHASRSFLFLSKKLEDSQRTGNTRKMATMNIWNKKGIGRMISQGRKLL
jgi:hypothetical protein